MRRLYFTIMFILPFIVSLYSMVYAFDIEELKTGDVILQPLHCSACTLIEEEEDSIFSHVGIVLIEDGEIKVAEAFGKVVKVSLEKFLKKTQKDQQVKVIRSVEVEKLNGVEFAHFEMNLIELFNNTYLGNKYDNLFLWNNFDERGKEKIYCSELVTKMLNPFLVSAIPTKKMHFDKNRESWKRFFKGNIPDGLDGISPGDLDRSDLFFDL